MSTNIIPINPTVTFDEFKGQVLRKELDDIFHSPSDNETEDRFCIYNSNNSHLWITRQPLSYNFDFNRYGMQGNWELVLDALVDQNIMERYVSEYDDEYDELLDF